MKKHNGKVYVEGIKHDIKELLEIIEILRSKDGCEWDRAQTHESLIECMRNETEEAIEAIEKKDDENFKEELGDVLLQVLLNSQIAKERGAFDFDGVVNELCEKLIRRHPHVFGDARRPETEEESLKLWQEIKKKEKMKKSDR